MRICFWSGEDDLLGHIIDVCPPMTNDFYSVLAGNGFVANLRSFNGLLESKPDCTVYTNSLIGLDHVFGWDERNQRSNIYLWDSTKEKFLSVNDLTKKMICYGHNIMQMVLNGAFELWRG